MSVCCRTFLESKETLNGVRAQLCTIIAHVRRCTTTQRSLNFKSGAEALDRTLVLKAIVQYVDSGLEYRKGSRVNKHRSSNGYLKQSRRKIPRFITSRGEAKRDRAIWPVVENPLKRRWVCPRHRWHKLPGLQPCAYLCSMLIRLTSRARVSG